MMRSIKNLLVFFLATTLTISCGDDDNESFVLQEISAPSNLNAIFDIAQDDSGEVTVTPTGVGASVFEVFFGDVENETPTEVAPGETITKVYGEGEFTLRIVAIGATGLTSELSRVVNISFTPPTGLAVDVTISDTNPFEITVSPTAENATVFDVLFGDEAADATPTTIMGGETVGHMYAEAGDYTVTVVARGAGSATVEVTEAVTISGNAAPIVLPITFDDATVNYAFGTFNGASYEVVDNPDLSGVNTEESKVGAITNSGAQFEGGAFILGAAVDFSGDNKTITMKFWSTSALPVLLKFEGGVNGDERQNEVLANHGGTGWEDLNFNFTTDATKSFIDGSQGVGEAFVPIGEYGTMVIFIDGPGTTAGTFYLDDINQISVDLVSPELPVDFESSSLDYTWSGFGSSDFGPIPASLIANPDASGINTSATVLEINKLAGAQVWAGASMNLARAIDFTSGTTINIKVWSPRAGTVVLFKIEDSSSTPDANGNPTVFTEISASTTLAMSWEELSFDLTSFAEFSTSASYDRVIIFPDFGNVGDDELFYFDDIAQTDGGAGTTDGKTSFPLDFETDGTGGTSVFEVFENDDDPVLAIISNPDTMGANTSANVAQFTAKVGGQPFAGIKTELETPFTLDATNSTVKIMVWKSVISNVGIKFESNFASTGEILVANTLTNQWEELTFDFSGKIGEVESANIDALVIFPDFDARTQDNIIYFDNVTLSAASGGSSTAPTMAAPTPTQLSADVISIYSNAYANVPNDGFNLYGAATFEEVQIAGDGALKYTFSTDGGGNFQVIELGGNQIDAEAAGMTNFRFDLWFPNMVDASSNFLMKLVDIPGSGVTEAQINIGSTSSPAMAQGTWLEFDIPFTELTSNGLGAKANIQQVVIDLMNSGEVYIDNIYFYKVAGGSSSTPPTVAAPTPSQVSTNVISVYSDAYANVPNDGLNLYGAAAFEEVQISGDGALKYTFSTDGGGNFQVIELGGNQIDATAAGMTNFRFDLWFPNAVDASSNFLLKLVDIPASGVTEALINIGNASSPAMAQGTWLQFDIPFTELESNGLGGEANIQQVVIDLMNSGEVYIDNIYFYKN